ncbi:MAG: BrnT family toxin [Bryobacteraceae bacterium]
MDEAIRFDWDKANTEQIARHGVKPEEAEQALENDPVDLNYEVVKAEDRWTSIGHTDRLRVLKLVWTLRDDIVRLVTALDASKNEAREYLQAKGIAL